MLTHHERVLVVKHSKEIDHCVKPAFVVVTKRLFYWLLWL